MKMTTFKSFDTLFHFNTIQSRIWILTRVRRSATVLMLVALSIALAGCGPTVSPTSFFGAWLAYLGMFVAVAYYAQTISKNISQQILISIVVTLILLATVLSGLILSALRSSDKRTDSRLNRIIEMIEARSSEDSLFTLLLALVSLIVPLIIGGLFAICLIQAAVVFPRLLIYTVTGIPLLLVISFCLLAFVSSDRRELRQVLDVVGIAEVESEVELFCLCLFLLLFCLCFGMLIAIGFLTPQLIIPVIVFVTGAGAVGYLGYQASTIKNERAKVGMYTASFLLAYELWLLVDGVAQVLSTILLPSMSPV